MKIEQVEMFVNAIEESAKNRPVRTPVAARFVRDEAELIEFLEKKEKADVEHFLKKNAIEFTKKASQLHILYFH